MHPHCSDTGSEYEDLVSDSKLPMDSDIRGKDCCELVKCQDEYCNIDKYYKPIIYSHWSIFYVCIDS